MNDANTNQAILFADIIDSMRLYESLGDEQAHTIACGCIGAIQQITLDHGGRVVKTMGDGIMCVFPSADKAFVASALMHDNPGCARVTVRVGFHVGPAIEDEGDVFGDAVNLAARVAAMAKGGETLLTGESIRLLSSMYVANTRLLDTTTLKGKSETV
ncbi:MAG: adenylate/guanylate cyclase domain-containing protein, partial [Pseudomonadota bacterium]|nr:adenylate/guanylate cyclase domain-containing protein [Pseudomonadota bacterium]